MRAAVAVEGNPVSESPKKRCSKCGTEKSLDDFHAIKKAKDGRQSYCKECMKASSRKANWARQDIDIDPDTRSLLDEAGDFRCAICDRTPEEVPGVFKELSVDHDHTSKGVRSLLCQPCNLAIGLFQEDPERMRIAADYVEFYYASEVLDPHNPRQLDDAKARPAVEEFLEWMKSRKQS